MRPGPRSLRLRPAGALAAGVLLVALFAQALAFERAMHARLATQLGARDNVRALLREADEATRFARVDQPRLLALTQQGVIGLPPRLRMVSALQALGDRAEVLALAWELGPPVPREVPAGAPTPAFTVLASALTLSVSLPGPADLAPLLETLRRASGGLPVERGCALERRVDGKLDARCTLDWLTVMPPAPGVGG